jgi:hypothetical protein
MAAVEWISPIRQDFGLGGTKVITSGGVVTPKTGGKHQPSEPESGGDKQRIHVITCKKRYLLAFCVSGFVAFLQMRI